MWPLVAGGWNSVPLVVKHIGHAEGLSSQRVSAIPEDADGVVWIATKTAIDRYNGRTLKSYMLPGDQSYGDRAGRKLGVCYAGRHGLWAYDQKGNISRYSPRMDGFEPYLTMRELVGSEGTQMGKLAIDADGVLWIALNIGLYKSEQAGKAQPVMAGRSVNDVIVAGDTVYAATHEGLWSICRKGTQNRWTERAQGLDIESLCLTDDGRELWMGTNDNGLRVLVMASGEIRQLPTTEAAWSNPIRALVDYDGQVMLAGIDGGGVYAVRRDLSQTQQLLCSRSGDPNSLKGNGIYAVLKDSQQNIWVGSYTGGVSMAIVPRYPLTLLTADSRGPWRVADNNVNDILQTRSGDLWMATDQGISICPQEPGKQARHILRGAVALTLAETDDGQVWTGTYGDGIWLMDSEGRTLRHLTKANGLTTNYIFSVRRQTDGDLWIGGMGGWLLHTDAQGRTKESYDIRWVNSIELSDHGEVGVATVDGFYLINPSTHDIRCLATAREFNDRQASAYIVSMAFEDTQAVWLGTEGGGVMRYDLQDHTIRQLTTRDGLPSDDIYAIHRDEQGQLWMSTGRGLARVDDGHRVTNLNYIGDVNKVYNKSSFARLADGRLAFGSTEGAVIFAPASTVESDYQAPLHWTDLTIDDVDEDGRPERPALFDMLQQGQVRLSYSQRSFAVYFESVNHLFQHDICYSWMLEGYDKNWNPRATTGMARYLHVHPGRYLLRVKALRSSDGSLIDECTLPIEVAAPWWATGWMFGVYALLLVGICYFIIRYVGNRIQKRYDEEKISFFIHTAHDIRTPVSLIAAPLEDLGRMTGLPQGAAELVEIAHTQTSKLLTLVGRLLEFERTETCGQMQSPHSICLNTLLSDELEGFRAVFQRKSITVGLQLPTEELCVWAERNLLEMLMDNLLSNACKYTPAEGRVQVSLHGNRQKVWLQVSDSGVGIPKAYQKQLFRNPFRAGNVEGLPVGGTGFGLIQVGRIVKILGGHIAVQSAEGKGTTFTITLPRSQSAPSTMPEQAIAPSVPPTSETPLPDAAYTLLIVEDHEELRAYLRRTFQGEYHVVDVPDAEQALQCLEGEYPDLVLSDVMMPGMDGDELCHRLKSNPDTAGIPVILLTAKTDQQSVIEGLKSGADDYIPKPFSTEVLRLKVRGMIENRNRLRTYLLQQALQQTESVSVATSDSAVTNPADETPAPGEQLTLSESDRLFIERATRLVLDHLADTSFTIDLLCREMAMSRTLFFNRLKSLTGQGPQEFIRMMRLQRAAEMLKEGKSVADVATETGFVNSKYFSSLFKKQFGIQPSRYGQEEN